MTPVEAGTPLRSDTFTAYTLAIAHQLTAQLLRIHSLPAELLAGQAANFPFWADEVAHCLTVLDNYEERYHRMISAERAWIEATVPFDPRPLLPVLPPRPVPRPGHISEPMQRYVRAELCRAFHHFAVSCYQCAHLDPGIVRAACDRLAIALGDDEVPRPA